MSTKSHYLLTSDLTQGPSNFPDRTKFKRYVSVPNPDRETLTLPRQTTAPNLKQQAEQARDPSPESKECEASENGADTRIGEESAGVVAESTEESKSEVNAPR